MRVFQPCNLLFVPSIYVLWFAQFCAVFKTSFKHKVVPQQKTFFGYDLSFNYIKIRFDYVLMV